MRETPNSLFQSDLKSLKLLNRGKVRDIYAVEEHHLLIITTDRISAFDVVLPDPIPGKGVVLTAVSNFWFQRTKHIVPNHLTDVRLDQLLPEGGERQQVEERAVIVRKLEPLPVEAIVRGYLIGSGWKDYQQTGAVSGIRLPVGLQQADKLAEAIYTPSTKAAMGAHDQNIDFQATVGLLGKERAERVREISLRLYTEAAALARDKGIIIADSKFEFGVDEDNNLVLIDELLTPDSSRFWAVDRYRVGESPPSFDKQFVRDYLETLEWDKKPPGPSLPAEIMEQTAARYREAQQRLVGC